MKTALSLLAVAAFLVSPSTSATQSAITSDDPPAVAGIRESDNELSPAVQSYIRRGDELSSRVRYDAAAREYARAADVARREGHLPSLTRWKVASAYFYAGNPAAAATALDQLTTEAALVGDLEVEALALYYAAWLDAKAGDKVEAVARIRRLEGLLRSRYMPVAVRDRVSGWLSTWKDVASSTGAS